MDTIANPVKGHPLYERIQAQIQADDWAGALTSLRMLRVSFPYDPDLERLQNMLEKQPVQTGPALAKPMAQDEPSPGRRRWLRLLAALLVVFLAGSLLLVTVLAYDQFAGAGKPDLERQAEAARARQTVQLALSSGDCRWAERAYQDLRHFVSEDRAVEAELARCQQRLALDELYAQAVQLLNAEDWEAARAAFADLNQRASAYKDLAVETSYLERNIEINTQWSEAQAACQGRMWETCVARLQALQQADLHFRRDEVQALLYDAAMQAGKACVARSKGTEESIGQAIAYFDLALRQQPTAQEALVARELAAAYALGRKLFDQQSWSAAAEQLAFLAKASPDYAEGHVSELLYLSRVQQGTLLEAQGNLLSALTTYQAALEVKGVDVSQAQAAVAQLEALLTPLPTPTSTPTPTLAATATPTATPQPPARPTSVPTATPTPLPYRFFSHGASLVADETCNSLTIQGWVVDDIYPMPGVEVTIWADSWAGPMVVTDVDGYYHYYLDNHPKIGTWYIKLSMGGKQISDVVPFSTRADCDSNLVYISWESRY